MNDVSIFEQKTKHSFVSPHPSRHMIDFVFDLNHRQGYYSPSLSFISYRCLWGGLRPQYSSILFSQRRGVLFFSAPSDVEGRLTILIKRPQTTHFLSGSQKREKGRAHKFGGASDEPACHEGDQWYHILLTQSIFTDIWLGDANLVVKVDLAI